MKSKQQKMPSSMQITAKGEALIAAIETGLLPEIEKDGVRGYDDELFSRFWHEFVARMQMWHDWPYGSR